MEKYYKKIKHKTRVKYLNINYTVHGKTVSCDLYFTIQFSKTPNMDFILSRATEICSKYNVVADNTYMDENENVVFQPVFKLRGSATCHKSDRFNFEVGRRIALTKAQRKAFNMAYNIYGDLRCIAAQLEEEFSKLMGGSLYACEDCDQHLEDLSK